MSQSTTAMSTGATVPTTGNRGGAGELGSVGGVRRSGGLGMLTPESKQFGRGVRLESTVVVEGTAHPHAVEDRSGAAGLRSDLVRRR